MCFSVASGVSNLPGRSYWSVFGEEESMDRNSPRISSAPINPDISITDLRYFSPYPLHSIFHDPLYTVFDARKAPIVATYLI